MHMNAIQEELFSVELAVARELIQKAEYEEAFHHLERAHILGQMQMRRHVLSHWLMLEVALHRGQSQRRWAKRCASSSAHSARPSAASLSVTPGVAT